MLKVISIVLLVIAMACVVVSMTFSIAMLGHLRNGNEALLRVIALGPFCPRSDFTDRGWRYRNIAVRTALCGVGMFAVWGFLLLLRNSRG